MILYSGEFSRHTISMHTQHWTFHGNNFHAKTVPFWLIAHFHTWHSEFFIHLQPHWIHVNLNRNTQTFRKTVIKTGNKMQHNINDQRAFSKEKCYPDGTYSRHIQITHTKQGYMYCSLFIHMISCNSAMTCDRTWDLVDKQ